MIWVPSLITTDKNLLDDGEDDVMFSINNKMCKINEEDPHELWELSVLINHR